METDTASTAVRGEAKLLFSSVNIASPPSPRISPLCALATSAMLCSLPRHALLFSFSISVDAVTEAELRSGGRDVRLDWSNIERGVTLSTGKSRMGLSDSSTNLAEVLVNQVVGATVNFGTSLAWDLGGWTIVRGAELVSWRCRLNWAELLFFSVNIVCPPSLRISPLCTPATSAMLCSLPRHAPLFSFSISVDAVTEAELRYGGGDVRWWQRQWVLAPDKL
ncbi:hypothetical protein Droror1_Dr00023943 [Drosera rotundifolia]